MWIFFINLFSISSIVGFIYLCRYNILVRTWVLRKPYLLNFGICVNGTVYTLISKIQVPNNQNYVYDIVIIRRFPTELVLIKLLSRSNFTVVKRSPPVGYALRYIDGDQELPYPYEEGTGCQVSTGEFVLSKRVRKRFGYGYQEVGRGSSWPFNNLDQIIN